MPSLPRPHDGRTWRRLTRAETIERFWLNVKKTDWCWLWIGNRSGGNNGGGPYGVLWSERRMTYAHRFSYELHRHEPIPEGLTIDHLCSNPLCVNPSHLEVVTLQENIRRGNGQSSIHSRQTMCLHGHPLTSDNLYNSIRGWRVCRVCSLERQRKYYAAKVAARGRP